jgi:hypothetical protein
MCFIANRSFTSSRVHTFIFSQLCGLRKSHTKFLEFVIVQSRRFITTNSCYVFEKVCYLQRKFYYSHTATITTSKKINEFSLINKSGDTFAIHALLSDHRRAGHRSSHIIVSSRDQHRHTQNVSTFKPIEFDDHTE